MLYRAAHFLTTVLIRGDWLQATSFVGHISQLERWQLTFSKPPLVSETT